MEEEHKEEEIIETKTEPVVEDTPATEEVEKIEKTIISEEKPKKTGAGCKIMAAFFFVATLGLGGFLLYHYTTFDHNPKTPEKKDETVVEQKEEKIEKTDESGKTITSTTVTSTIAASSEEELAVRSVVTEVNNAINKATETELSKRFSFFTVYDSGAPLIKLTEAKIPLRALKSYGLFAPISEFHVGDGSSLKAESVIGKAVVDKLTELGFTKNEEIPNIVIVTGGVHYTNEQTGVTCSYTPESLPIGFDCSHKSWISADTVKIANELAEAYYKKEGTYPITIGAEHYTIKDSPVSPYQILTTSVANGAGFFYRVSKESSWVFFQGTQAGISCNEYDTKDLRNAFAGEKCWDDATSDYALVEAWGEEE